MNWADSESPDFDPPRGLFLSEMPHRFLVVVPLSPQADSDLIFVCPICISQLDTFGGTLLPLFCPVLWIAFQRTWRVLHSWFVGKNPVFWHSVRA
jgi:hypothetical protein